MTGCSQQLPLVPARVPSLPDNTVCNHQFNANQRSLAPSFIEREANSIIDGNNVEELLNSIRVQTAHNGQGNTRWTISWSYDSQPGVAGCRLTNIETNVVVSYHLPLWPEQLVSNNRALAAQWTQYSDALRSYHCQHGKLGIDASIEVMSKLQELGASGGCKSLMQEADALADSIIEKYRQIEAGFVPPKINQYLRQP